jgi:site-specific DNA recombinase
VLARRQSTGRQGLSQGVRRRRIQWSPPRPTGIERPAHDLKANVFDAVYFLNTDRIARDVTYQNLIIAELLKYKKQIIINGLDYVDNPENKFTLTVLGAVAELERAKISERMARGRLHRLRMGQMAGHGTSTYGYDYIMKTELSPPALVINTREANIVRSIFEMYVNANMRLRRITRTLEAKAIPTRKGKRL